MSDIEQQSEETASFEASLMRVSATQGESSPGTPSSSTGAASNVSSGGESSGPSPASTGKEKDKWTGRVLGHYQIMRRVGAGAMGTVFQARDTSLSRIVALKVLPRQQAGFSDASRLEMFFREARSAASIDHPNVAHIYEVGEFKGWWFIAMEFLEGGSLTSMLEGAGPMDPSRALLLILDAARGLAELHNEGIIHRDIKPSNLMLSRKSRCKLVDFGLVRLDEQDDPFEFKKRLVGTPRYMAPEIIRQATVTPAVDVYSLGATFYHMLTGRPPYLGKTVEEILRQALDAPPPPVTTPNCPPSLNALIQKMLAKRPEDRPSMDAIIAELQMSMGPGGLGVGSLSTSSLSGFTPPPGGFKETPPAMPLWRRPAVLAGAGVGLVGLIGLVVFLASGSSLTKWNEALPEMIDLQAKSTASWERVAKADGALGIKALQEAADIQRRKAESFFAAKDLERTRQSYGALLESCKALESRITQRDAVVKLQQETQSKVEKFRRGGSAALPKQETELQGLLTKANASNTAPDFKETLQAWQTLSDAADKALRSWDTLQTINKEWSALQQKRNTADVTQIGLYAQGLWQEYLKFQKQIETTEQMQRLPLIRGANDRLSRAIKQAQEVAATRPAAHPTTAQVAPASNAKPTTKPAPPSNANNTQTPAEKIAAALALAQAKEKSHDWQGALVALDRVLTIEPDHALAAALHTNILIKHGYRPGYVRKCYDQIQMAYCPAGSFQMGSPSSEPNRGADEEIHQVELTRGFFMSTTEVTQELWQKVMGSPPPRPLTGAAATMAPADPKNPVSNVTWTEAVTFCQKLSTQSKKTYRLPTEAEWEYACRAGTTTAYHAGPTINNQQANVDGQEAQHKILNTGQFKPNAWGLLDMHGNVMEWCSDWAGETPRGSTDPTGPRDRPSSGCRVARGGSFRLPAPMARSAKRFSFSPEYHDPSLGFRVVLVVE